MQACNSKVSRTRKVKLNLDCESTVVVVVVVCLYDFCMFNSSSPHLCVLSPYKFCVCSIRP